MSLKEIEKLRNQVSSLLDGETDQKKIEAIGKIGASIDSIETEHGETEQKLVETTKAYADMVKHTSFKGEATDKAGEETKTAPTLEELIIQEIEKESKA